MSNGEIIADQITFNHNSINEGNANGPTTFNNQSANHGLVGANAIFNDFSYNAPSGSIPDDIDFYDDGEGNVEVMLYNGVGVNGNGTFNQNSINNGLVVYDATFNNNSINKGTISAPAIFTQLNIVTLGTFNDSALNDTSGQVYRNAVFNNNSINKGQVANTATFNNNACNDNGTANTFVPNPPPTCA